MAYESDLERLRAFFNPALLLNFKTRQPLSAEYRNILLGFAYELYGKRIIQQLRAKTGELTKLTLSAV